MRTPIIIDTDGGTDDAVALWWALTTSSVEVVAILATWGNVELHAAAATCQRVVVAAGRTDVPIALGASEPVGPSPIAERATFVHGADGLGGHGYRWPTDGGQPVEESAPELLRRVTHERPGEIVLVLVTIGPLSTLAKARRDEPALAKRVRDLVVMGGAVERSGNLLPLGEANIANDPVGAAEVVEAEWSNPPILVGLDVTLAALLDGRHLALADQHRTPAARMLAEPLRAYANFYDRSQQTAPGTFPCHDLLAVLAAVIPEIIVDAPVLPLAVDVGGSAAWGATVADRRREPQSQLPGFFPWRVALDVDEPMFQAEAERLLSGDGLDPSIGCPPPSG